jgi:hypothetical protein
MPTEHPQIQNVRLEDVDLAIRDWFDKTVDSHVQQPNGDRKKVSVGWSAGERWVSSRTKKGIRDDNGVLILPIISIRRSSIEPSPIMSSLGAETPTLQISRQISKKTNDLANLWSLRDPSRRQPLKPVVYEITTIPFPDRNILTYEVQIQAQYIGQMNTIIEKIFHELDISKSFVAPFDNEGRHPPIGETFETRKPLNKEYVVGFFDSTISDGGNFEEFTDQERIVRFNTSIKVPAVLRLDPEGEKPGIEVTRTAFGIDFGDEQANFVDNYDDLEKIFGK